MVYDGKNLKLIKNGNIFDVFDTFKLEIDDDNPNNPLIVVNTDNNDFISERKTFTLSFFPIKTNNGTFSSGGENDTAYFTNASNNLSTIITNGIK